MKMMVMVVVIALGRLRTVTGREWKEERKREKERPENMKTEM